MNCLRCNTENLIGAKFCKNCGMNLTYTPSNHNTISKISDKFLMIFIVIAFVSTLIQFVIQKFVDNWYESPIKYIQETFWLLQNLSFILIPLSIKNKALKITGLVITLIMVIYWAFTNIGINTANIG